jgi:hypothetical protein
MVAPLRHRQTKEAETDMFDLQPPRHISTLHATAVRVGSAYFETAQALDPDVPATLIARADQGDQLEMAVSCGATPEVARTRPTFQRAGFRLIEAKRTCCCGAVMRAYDPNPT